MEKVIVKQEGKEEEGKVYIGSSSEPIQKALDYLKSKGGGKLFIEKGTYSINNNSNDGIDGFGYKGIQIYSNIEVYGEGASTILSGAYYDTANYPSTVSILDAKNVIIRDLKITGGYCGLIAYKCDSIKIDDCIADTCSYNGIYVIECTNSIITNNVCSNNSNNGIYINKESNDSIITNNICSNNRASGIYINGSLRCTIASNISNSNKAYGLYSDNNANDNIITGNVFNDNTNYAIYIYSAICNTIVGNVCNKNSQGIYLYSSSKNIISGNICVDNSGEGIYIYNYKQNIVISNIADIYDGGDNSEKYFNYKTERGAVQ